MTIKEWLDSLKVGDQVIRVGYGFTGTRILQTIESISGKKRKVITLTGGERFNGTTGRKQEDASSRNRIGVRPRIEEATPEFKADQERKQRINKARSGFARVYEAIKHAEDPAAIEAAAAALEAILHPVPPPPPQLLSRDELAAAWNEDADHANRWDSLDIEEQLEWAQLRADRARRQREAG